MSSLTGSAAPVGVDSATERQIGQPRTCSPEDRNSRRQRNSHALPIYDGQMTGTSLGARYISARGVERGSESGGIVDLCSSGLNDRLGQVETLELGDVRGKGGVSVVGSLTVSELVGLDHYCRISR